jgi:hypothetical protein
MAILNSFTPNTVMSATAVNANFSDCGTEITGSLARDGQSSMSGQMKVIDGSAGAPGIAFGNDTNTGFRRASADEMRWVAGGVDRFFVDSAGKAWQLGAMDVAGALNLQGALSGAGVPDLAAIEALTGVGALRRTGINTWALDNGTTNLCLIKSSNGVALAAGIIGDIEVHHAATITAVTMLADQSGSAVVDIWKDSYANFPPTVADTITAAAKPTISAATKSTDSTLTGWTTSVAAGDILRFNLDSVATITRLGIFLTIKRYT